MVMQVHDELVFEVEEKAVQSATSLITDFMQQAAELAVPLVVDVGVGESWEGAH
jgi:DNA polymerase-1